MLLKKRLKILRMMFWPLVEILSSGKPSKARNGRLAQSVQSVKSKLEHLDLPIAGPEMWTLTLTVCIVSINVLRD